MIEAMYLYHLVRGPFQTMARRLVCRSLARLPSASLHRLVRPCPELQLLTTTNDSRANARTTR